jgi:hypothetical protein
MEGEFWWEKRTTGNGEKGGGEEGRRPKKGRKKGVKWANGDKGIKERIKKGEQRKQGKKGEGNGKEFENGRRGHFKRGIFEGQMDGRADLTLGRKMNE